ncbi:MAG: hypothetical protein ACHQUC_09600 [Chlamydiales bacterium]
MHAIILFFCCLIPSIISAEYWTVEGRISYFYPASADIRKTYGDAFVDYQIELARSVFCDWEVWLDLDYYTKRGRFHHRQDSSRLQVIPLSLGVKYYVHLRRDIDWYVGGGGSYGCANIRNHSDCAKRNMTKWGFGGIFKTGIKYYWNDCLSIDLFLDYFYQHFRLHHKHKHKMMQQIYPLLESEESDSSSSSNCFFVKDTLNVGGTKIGLAIGWTF